MYVSHVKCGVGCDPGEVKSYTIGAITFYLYLRGGPHAVQR